MKISRPLLLATAMTAALGSIAAVAAADGHKRAGKQFPIDLSVAEQHNAARFAAIDSNDDEQISLAEFMAHQPARAHAEGSKRHHRPQGEHGFKGHGGWRDDSAMTDEQRAQRRAAFEAELFAAMDSDGNGQLSTTEASRDNRRSAMRTLGKQKAFARMDADGDGNLSRAEFGSRLTRLQGADTDGDGQVSRAEVKSLRRSRSES